MFRRLIASLVAVLAVPAVALACEAHRAKNAEAAGQEKMVVAQVEKPKAETLKPPSSAPAAVRPAPTQAQPQQQKLQTMQPAPMATAQVAAADAGTTAPTSKGKPSAKDVSAPKTTK
jgi:hypothetical protein